MATKTLYPEKIFVIKKKLTFPQQMPILNTEEARTRIREILKSEVVWPANHCKEMMLWRNVQMEDIIHCLQWGIVEYGQEDGDKENNIFRVIWTDIEEEPLTVVVQIENEAERLRCLTVF
jgi:hypothetical protein